MNMPLCACPGCENPRRDKSIYCCERCQQKASRIKARNYNAAYVKAHRGTALKTYAESRKVLVRDPKCGETYRITKSELAMYAREYEKLGIEVVVG